MFSCPSWVRPNSNKNAPLPLVLPAPITGYDGIYFCEHDDAAAFLRISAEGVHRGHPHIGKYSSGWRVKEDRKYKWGWIDEFAHDGSGRGSSPAAVYHNHSLVFHLKDNIGHAYSNNDSHSSKRDLLIRIAFLKTYKNTGQFDIYLCGVYLQSIDTCWGNPKIKVSTTELSFIPVRGGFPPECNHNPTPILEFRHVWMDRNTTEDSIVGCDRRHQKLKLVDVTVCTAENIYR